MKKQTYENIKIQELSWDKVRKDVIEANPTLADIIDKFDPPKEYTFLKARYLFGDRILNEGVMHLPLEKGGTIPLHDDQVPKVLQNKLNYSSVPMALILNKTVEVFFETEDRVMPSKLFSTGTTFGLWEAFDPPPSEFVKRVWNLSAGARSICMLPSISDSASHARLRRDYSINSYPPKTLLDHSKVFIELSRRLDQSDKTWYCDILFFCNKWLDYRDDELGCVRLHKYWIHEAWNQSFNCRNQMSYDVAWEAFSKEVTRRNWKPKPYLINVIKHLLAIGEGIFPGFTPATNNEIAAPIKFLQDCYVNNYLLKEYAPIIITPHHLREQSIPVYYSLALPSQIEHAPRARNTPSIIGDIRELKMLMKVLLESMNDNHISYEFFHSEKDQYGDIKHSSEMPSSDKRLLQYPEEYGKRKFPDNSAFFRGCVQIKKMKN